MLARCDLLKSIGVTFDNPDEVLSSYPSSDGRRVFLYIPPTFPDGLAIALCEMIRLWRSIDIFGSPGTSHAGTTTSVIKRVSVVFG